MTGDSAAGAAGAAAAPGAGRAAGAAGLDSSEEELAAVLAALPRGGASIESGEDPFTAWRRRRLAALGLRASSTTPR